MKRCLIKQKWLWIRRERYNSNPYASSHYYIEYKHIILDYRRTFYTTDLGRNSVIKERYDNNVLPYLAKRDIDRLYKEQEKNNQ